jgi:hypothetical protein
MSARNRPERMARVRLSRSRMRRKIDRAVRARRVNRRQFVQGSLAAAISARLRPAFGRNPRGYPVVPPPAPVALLGVNFQGNGGYFNPEQPFLNLLDMAGSNNPYIGWFVTTGGIGGVSNGQEPLLYTLLDANGYPTTLSPAALSGAGITAGATIWMWTCDLTNSNLTAPYYPAGNYTVQGTGGAGTMQLAGDVTLASLVGSTYASVNTSTGVITLTAPAGVPWTVTFNCTGNGTGFKVGMSATDPSSTGNYIKGLALVQTQYLAAYNAGEWFHPNFKNAVAMGKIPLARFMGWLDTNSAVAVSGAGGGGLAAPGVLTGTPTTGTTVVNMISNWQLPTRSNYTVTLANGQQITGCTCTYNSPTITLGSAVSSAPFLGVVSGWSQPSTNIMIQAIQNFADRPVPANLFKSSCKGVPWEYCIQLCNEMYTGYGLVMAPWLNVPVSWSDSMVTAFAQLCYNGTGSAVAGFGGINIALKARIESGNETWNSFEPELNNYIYQAYQGWQTMSGVSTNITSIQQNQNGVRAAHVASLFAAVYGVSFAGRVACQISGQAASTSIAATALAASLWVSATSGVAPYLQTATSPATGYLISAIHIAPYFGSNSGFNSGDWAVLSAQSDGGLSYFFQSMTSNVMSGGSNPGYTLTTSGCGATGWLGNSSAVPSVAAHVASMASYRNLPVLLYESGQTMQVNSGDPSYLAQAQLFITANNDARMGAVYTSYYTQMQAAGASTMCVFTFCSAPSATAGQNWGMFQMASQYTQAFASTPPRWQAFVTFNGGPAVPMTVPNLSVLGTTLPGSNVTLYGNLNVPGMAAGASFNDPVTGMLHWKLTSGTVPATEPAYCPVYSEGPLQISLAWGANLDQYTIMFMNPVSSVGYLCDFGLSTSATPGPYNYRTAPTALNGYATVGAATFSRLAPAAHPQLMYVLAAGGYLRLFDASNSVMAYVDSNAAAYGYSASWPSTGWPWTTSLNQWLSTCADETWIIGNNGNSSKNTAYALNLHTGVTRTWNITQDDMNVGYGHYVTGDAQTQIWELDSNTQVSYSTQFTAANGWSGSEATFHIASTRGQWVAYNTNAGGGIVPLGTIGNLPTNLNNVTLASVAENEYWGQFHGSAKWWTQNPSAGQYFLQSSWSSYQSGWSANALYALTWYNAQTGAGYRQGHSYSTVQPNAGATGNFGTSNNINGYYSQPHATTSHDGKLTIYGSTMLGSARVDLFATETPVTPGQPYAFP